MELKEGIVTRVIDYRDNAKIITVITNIGSQGLIVKGATNLKSHTFSYTEELIKINFDSKKKYLTSGRILNSYRNIKADFNKLSSALRIMEIVNTLVEHINDFQTFYNFFDQILLLINDDIDFQKLEIIFRIKTLYLLGLSPNFLRCVDCDTTENLVGFSLFSGGMKCCDHITNEDYLVNHEIIKQLRIMYLGKLDNLLKNFDKVECDYLGCDNFLNIYYDHFLGFNSRVKNIIGIL